VGYRDLRIILLSWSGSHRAASIWLEPAGTGARSISLTHFGAMLQERASIVELLLGIVQSGCGQALWRDASTAGVTGLRPATSP
jgi:hypothetical protein